MISSRHGISQLGIFFSYISLLFSYESSRGKIPAPPLNDSPGSSEFEFLFCCFTSIAKSKFFPEMFTGKAVQRIS